MLSAGLLLQPPPWSLAQAPQKTKAWWHGGPTLVEPTFNLQRIMNDNYIDVLEIFDNGDQITPVPTALNAAFALGNAIPTGLQKLRIDSPASSAYSGHRL